MSKPTTLLLGYLEMRDYIAIGTRLQNIRRVARWQTWKVPIKFYVMRWLIIEKILKILRESIMVWKTAILILEMLPPSHSCFEMHTHAICEEIGTTLCLWVQVYCG